MEEKWEEFYDALVDHICRLLFNREGCTDSPYKAVVEAWLQAQGLGSEDIKELLGK